ncbi:hypothetical protein EDC04DRAFT_2713289 [Pisolithus marmoratus]|nr:hypothetical protein EDC04DRAFT_2759935 [Pisolithus marmoratus]KAI6022081.1 hypothetical protein EDC04DRAFT_2730639 [Pisolithus marmoratus]KAI6030125.1 hypothetical protein EDC04DRAFT_2713289 [Pisolithus marmoratus]
MLEEKFLFPPSDAAEYIAYVGGGNGSMALDYEIVFVSRWVTYCSCKHAGLR